MPNQRTDLDLIVVGAGSAGLPCAITAAENGAKVLVIEKAAEVGGTLHVTGGHMSAGGTRRQQARHIHDSPEQHFADVMRISQGTVDTALVRLAVEEAPNTINWLEDLGFEFMPDTPLLVYGHETYSVPRTYWGVAAGKSILAALLPAWDKQVATGNITLLLQSNLLELIGEGDTVKGVRVQSQNRVEDFFADAVVLATGGYAANPPFFRSVTPGNPHLVSTAKPTSTGEGITIAQKIGAQFRGAEKYLPSVGGIELAPGRADFWTDWIVFAPNSRPPREIYVNVHGERFIAEDTPGPDPRERVILAQPEQKFWLVFDETALNDGNTPVRQWNAATLREKAAKGEQVWAAVTLAELARKAGINSEGLLKTVAAYNLGVEYNNDPCGRTDPRRKIEQAPFYALLTRATSLISFGGLAVNQNLEVLNHDNEVIKGLYAIGEILGAGATSGNAFCGGMLLTPALTFGRVLGATLAINTLQGAAVGQF
jgi:fumarate reductase flavoprotein subunit